MHQTLRRSGMPSPSTKQSTVFTTRMRIWPAKTTLIQMHQLKGMLKLLKHSYILDKLTKFYSKWYLISIFFSFKLLSFTSHNFLTAWLFLIFFFSCTRRSQSNMRMSIKIFITILWCILTSLYLGQFTSNLDHTFTYHYFFTTTKISTKYFSLHKY